MNKNEILIFSGGKFSKLYCLDYFEEGVFETGALIGRTARARGCHQLWRAAVKNNISILEQSVCQLQTGL